ncbi:MAG: DNA-directed RNA polymerase subunit omega [Flavobacteriaceae bacterium]|nr:DNA-directed RNA polymerase subunit omega [Flavobacteriaceae bacterium]
MDYKNSEAPLTTVTYDKTKIEEPTHNIYESISIMAKRAIQINEDLKKELIDKLEEFATHNDSLEEIFENKEQIEVSRFYEKLPKSTAIAIEEWLEGKIYSRKPETTDDNE